LFLEEGGPISSSTPRSV